MTTDPDPRNCVECGAVITREYLETCGLEDDEEAICQECDERDAIERGDF